MAARSSRRVATATWVALVMALWATACSTEQGAPSDAAAPDASTPDDAARAPRTIRVPQDQATIQAAVDVSRAGDLILIGPGEYRETVTVETPRVVLRGADRNTVIIDGQFDRENGIKVFSDGVAVENLTVRHHQGNGVLFTGDYQSGNPLDGFRISYVTAHNNGLYGVYAFGATNGLIEHTYTSGSPDAGIYVGQCSPCNTVVIDAVSELNAAGFQGANASGGLVVTRSVFRSNRIGIESVSTTKELLAPQRDADIVANLVDANNGVGAPQSIETFGVGIAVGGGRANRIRRNTVTGHATAGIVLSDKERFLPEGNRVEENRAVGNGVDLIYAVASGALLGNCFDGNEFATSSPPEIQRVAACAPEATGAPGTIRLGPIPPAVSYRDVPAPGPQAQMPGAIDGPPRDATDPRPPLDLDAMVVPS